MPTYEYLCDSCGHEFEKFQSITSGSLRKCPECKKMKLNRLIGSGGGIIFKGSGFYQTDYRSDSYRKAAESDSKQASAKTTSNADSKKSSGKPKAKSSD